MVKRKPCYLEVLLKPLPQGIRNLMEANELSHPEHLRVVPGRPRVQSLDDGAHVAKDAGVHEGWKEKAKRKSRKIPQ